MHRHSPLMRSLLSQSQTPTSPRRAVGFFGFGCPAGCPAELITQSTLDWLMLFEPILSIVDGPTVGCWLIIVNARFRCNFDFADLHTGKCNRLKRARLLNLASTCSRFAQSLAQIRGNRASVAG